MDTSGHPTKCISDFELSESVLTVTCLVIHNEQEIFIILVNILY